MFTHEEMYDLGRIAEILPEKRSRQAIWRWCLKGINGVKLEHRRLGRTIFTSKEALDRFGERLAEAHTARREAAKSLPRPRDIEQHERDVQDADLRQVDNELDGEGL